MRASTLFINQRWERTVSPRTKMPSINPATGEVMDTFTVATQFDVNKAVASARVSFKTWRLTSGAERAVVLRRVAEAVLASKDKLAMLETRDTGKPLKETEWDIDDVAACFNYYAGHAELLDKRQNTPSESLGDDDYEAHTLFVPTGVVAAVIPWNYPLLMMAWKVAPALAAGCTIVVKPSENTVLSILEFADIITPILPAGVVNVVTGAGDTGRMLVEHTDIDKVAFTGSVPTGIRVGVAAMRNLNAVTLELGGKSPILVFDDCDMRTAVEWVMFGCFWTNGQICSATSRLLVAESIAPEFLALLCEATAAIPIINPCADEHKATMGAIGPLISAAQHERVLSFIAGAVADGAEVLCGGGVPVGDMYTHGYYVQPTILRATPRMKVWNEEVFGPVLSVMTFATEDEAVRLANDCQYGLAAAVMSNSRDRLQRVTRALDAGIVWQQCSQPCFVQVPWGGMKRSGVGRELGPNGIDNYLEPKQVVRYKSDAPLGWYTLPGTAKL